MKICLQNLTFIIFENFVRVKNKNAEYRGILGELKGYSKAKFEHFDVSVRF